jgi:hypothetical protein
MAKKSKKAKKTTKKRPPTKKKKSNNLVVYLILGLAVVAAYFFLSGRIGGSAARIGNCVFSPASNKLECDVLEGRVHCNMNDDIVVLVKDNSDNSMIAFNTEGSSLMGYVDIGDKIEAVVVSVPGEDLIDETSGCSEAFLICGEDVYSSTCTFV